VCVHLLRLLYCTHTQTNTIRTPVDYDRFTIFLFIKDLLFHECILCVFVGGSNSRISFLLHYNFFFYTMYGRFV
jgi:hypothetical protein